MLLTPIYLVYSSQLHDIAEANSVRTQMMPVIDSDLRDAANLSKADVGAACGDHNNTLPHETGDSVRCCRPDAPSLPCTIALMREDAGS